MVLLYSQWISGTEAQVHVVVPQGIDSVNGSDVTMGCTSPLVDISGLLVCSSDCSRLHDGISPTIDTSTSDWASQLVTVRITEYTENIPYPHVLLTFGFDTNVSLTRIELDMFICPEWNIAVPSITVYVDEESNLVFNGRARLPFQHFYLPSQSSCDSLSTVSINLRGWFRGPSYYLTWHIMVSGFLDSIRWVHVGEVRFLGADSTPPTPPLSTCGIMMKSSIQSKNFITCIQFLCNGTSILYIIYSTWFVHRQQIPNNLLKVYCHNVILWHPISR